MIKMGTMVGDRYEILELVGTGGMADVYKAKCHKLNRFVAVKVLKQEFSENKEFVSKFRTEAQAAAGLAHPNIVNVYDVGEEEGIYYIVMELVEGITLKRYIEKKARLTVRESVSIAIKIAMGIEAAHNNGIIHRDIKPQNIIISKDGEVKVTDFGIAKAATSNTITSNVMGSVHYTSPEQARGGFSDEKSDIYSLGITLFEMLTGRVPFNGETTVTIAIKHIQEDMPSPRNYVPEIPISVEQIVLKCTQKSPDRRYQKVNEFIEDLKKSLISPNENFVKMDTMENNGATQVVTAKDRNTGRIPSQGSAAEAGGIALNTGAINIEDKKMNYDPVSPRSPRRAEQSEERSREARETKKQGTRKPVSKQEGRNRNSEVKDSQRKRNVRTEVIEESKRNGKKASQNSRRQREYDEPEDDTVLDKIKTVLIIVIAVLIGCIILYFAGYAMGVFGNGSIFGDGSSSSKSTVTIPDVEGLVFKEATRQFERIDLAYEVEYAPSSEVISNHVIETKPAIGEKVSADTVVTIVVSMEGNGAAVPNVFGLSEAEATSKLEAEGFKVIKKQDFDEEVAKGTVMGQNPEADTFLDRDGEITITISLGSSKAQYTMPDLTGNSEESARETISKMGLVCAGVSEAYDDNVAEGLVCEQSFQAGATVKEGQEVSIVLSRGPEPRYYDCNISVSAPPKYVGGDANVILKASDGTELFNTSTSSFPVNINLSQIYGIPKGTVVVTYTIYSEEDLLDDNGNSLGIQQVPAQDTYTYDVDFN